MPAATATRVPFQVADCFVLALDDFMRRTRQGGHVSQSVLELDRLPDLPRLRAALAPGARQTSAPRGQPAPRLEDAPALLVGARCRRRAGCRSACGVKPAPTVSLRGATPRPTRTGCFRT